ncbi:MAG: HEAT repeat domain-containing protein, partial [Armatimonadetes bacterium]|nr:HEAT repeat domain-containing protein [Armatimonadota bacterium]
MLDLLKLRTLSQGEIDSFVELGEAARDQLVEILDSPTVCVNEKYNAVLVLKALAEKGEIAIPGEPLRRFVENELQLAYHRMLIMLHGQFQVTRGVELLFQHLEEKNGEALLACIRALCMTGENVLCIPRATIYQVRNKGSAEWQELTTALRGMADQEMAQFLLVLMESEPGRIKDTAHKAWKMAPLPRDEALGEMLKDRDIWVQVCALYIIGEMQVLSLKWEVFKKIEDPDEVVRETAIRSLGLMKKDIRDPVILETLQQIVTVEEGAAKDAAKLVLEAAAVSDRTAEDIQEAYERG